MPLTQDQRDFVEQHLLKVSRTFAPGIGQLRKELREGVGLAYLLCRILDTIEDSAHMPAEPRVALLEAAAALSLSNDLEPAKTWAAKVASFFDAETSDDAVLCQQAGEVVDCLHVIAPAQRAAIEVGFTAMARGMAAFTQRTESEGGFRIESLQDLRDYCYYVAGTVGEILSRLFIAARDYPEAVADALTSRDVAFGIGLQVVNILKGVKADFQRAAQFVPDELLSAEAVTLVRVLEDDSSPAARAIAAGLIQEAVGNLQEAIRYTLSVPVEDDDIRAFCAFPILLALRTCRLALESDRVFPEDNALRVPRPEVEAMLSALPTTIADNASLASAFDRELEPVKSKLAARNEEHE